MTATLGAGCDDGNVPNNNGEDPGPPPPPPEQIGTTAYLDLQYVNLPPPFDALGNGPVTVIGPYLNAEDHVPPSYAQTPGPFGCKVFEFTPEQYANPGVNVGAWTFTVHGGNWVTPPCVQIPGLGWACPGAMGGGGDIRVVDADMGIYSLTDPAAGFTGEDEVGRYLSIEGAATPGNNGFFFVVGAAAEDSILFFNPGPGAEELGTAGGYVTIGGFGPAARDEPIPDGAALQVQLTTAAGEESAYEDFETFLPFGSSFVLDEQSQERISNIPVDGSPFELGCDGPGGECRPAIGTAMILEASDGSLEGLPPFLVPPPATKLTQVFCLNLAGHIQVPAEASAFLASSGATRIRTVMARVVSADIHSGTGLSTVLAGHAQAGFTDL